MNLFRAKLGIGLSPEQKKGPQFRFVPGVGLVQIVVEQAIVPQVILPPIKRADFLDGGTPFSIGFVSFDAGGPSIDGEIYDFGKP
jgi:hypothetical protein